MEHEGTLPRLEQRGAGHQRRFLAGSCLVQHQLALGQQLVHHRRDAPAIRAQQHDARKSAHRLLDQRRFDFGERAQVLLDRDNVLRRRRSLI